MDKTEDRQTYRRVETMNNDTITLALRIQEMIKMSIGCLKWTTRLSPWPEAVLCEDARSQRRWSVAVSGAP